MKIYKSLIFYVFISDDINSNRLSYELTDFDVMTSNDSFVYDVMDSSLNQVTDNIFRIQWSWLFMVSKEYNASETDGQVDVRIRRTGNLKQISSVVCSLHGVTANGPRKEKHKNQKSKNKKTHADFSPLISKTHFKIDETEKTCSISIKDDVHYEGLESLTVRLSNANHAIISKPKKSIINIYDEEDKPKISFSSKNFFVNETDGLVSLELLRYGDFTNPAAVICITDDGTAISSTDSFNHDEKDFLQRPDTIGSIVNFSRGEQNSSCDVRIFDDSVFELNESFGIRLKHIDGNAIIGRIQNATVTILENSDSSVISLMEKNINVSETDGKVKVEIRRKGKNLNYISSVWCSSKSFSPEEAMHSVDYIHHSEQVIFKENQESAFCEISIIDDRANPRWEGLERFVVFLSNSQNSTLDNSKAETIVAIIDEEDVPKIQFKKTEFKVRENQTIAKIPLIRTGDLSRISSVICFTRQRSAKAGIDFMERPNTKNSAVQFPQGVSKLDCEIGLLDDPNFEKEEEFIVKLSHPDSPSGNRPILGNNKVSRISIFDWEDRPRITFEHAMYTVAEPMSSDLTSVVKINLLRLGDTTQNTLIKVITRDGTASAGQDFKPLKKSVEFSPGETRSVLNI